MRASGARRTASSRTAHTVTWEVRTFGATAGAIVLGFLFAVLYLGQITSLSAVGYETQRLEARREELVRQNALLDVQLAKLDAPARIEAQAARLGLVRAPGVLVMNAPELAATK